VIEEILREIEILRSISGKPEYFMRLRRIKELWKKFEQSMPVYTEDEIKRIIRFRVGKVNLERCCEVCRVLAVAERPLRFTEIKEGVRDSHEFDVSSRSLNKVLSRVLKTLASAGLVARCGRVTRAGRESEVYYFRLFRLAETGHKSCERCPFLMKIAEIVEKALARRGSNFRDDVQVNSSGENVSRCRNL